MFAYCENNPISKADPNGQKGIWNVLFEDNQYGYIHIRVQLEIAKNYGMSIERAVYKAGKKVGRVDVFDPATGFIWEIKTTSSIATAESQIERYAGGNIGNTGLIAIIGPADAFCGDFTINYANSTYLVHYFTPIDGTIVYSVKRISYQSKSDYVYVSRKERQNTQQSQPEVRTGQIAAYTPGVTMVNCMVPDSGGRTAAIIFGGVICAAYTVGMCSNMIRTLS